MDSRSPVRLLAILADHWGASDWLDAEKESEADVDEGTNVDDGEDRSSACPISTGMLIWFITASAFLDRPARFKMTRFTRGSFIRRSFHRVLNPRNSAWIRHAASARIARFHSRYCAYVVARGARSVAPFGGRP